MSVFFDLGMQKGVSALVSLERVPDTHWKGDRVDPRTGLDDMEGSKIRDPRNMNREPLSRRFTDRVTAAPHGVVCHSLNIFIVSNVIRKP
jgi:hypothetical protein